MKKVIFILILFTMVLRKLATLIWRRAKPLTNYFKLYIKQFSHIVWMQKKTEKNPGYEDK